MNVLKHIFLLACFLGGAASLCVDTPVTTPTTSEDVSQLFDGDDVLDNVSIEIIGGPNSMYHENPSMFKTYCQSALLYMLSSYLAAKKFVVSHMPWALATPNKTA